MTISSIETVGFAMLYFNMRDDKIHSFTTHLMDAPLDESMMHLRENAVYRTDAGTNIDNLMESIQNNSLISKFYIVTYISQDALINHIPALMKELSRNAKLREKIHFIFVSKNAKIPKSLHSQRKNLVGKVAFTDILLGKVLQSQLVGLVLNAEEGGIFPHSFFVMENNKQKIINCVEKKLFHYFFEHAKKRIPYLGSQSGPYLSG